MSLTVKSTARLHMINGSYVLLLPLSCSAWVSFSPLKSAKYVFFFFFFFSPVVLLRPFPNSLSHMVSYRRPEDTITWLQPLNWRQQKCLSVFCKSQISRSGLWWMLGLGFFDYMKCFLDDSHSHCLLGWLLKIKCKKKKVKRKSRIHDKSSRYGPMCVLLWLIQVLTSWNDYVMAVKMWKIHCLLGKIS